MARGWASALANRGIRVKVLVPGTISTNFRRFMSDEVREEFEAHVVSGVPLARVGTAEEAAAVALFLLSDDASYVNRQPVRRRWRPHEAGDGFDHVLGHDRPEACSRRRSRWLVALADQAPLGDPERFLQA